MNRKIFVWVFEAAFLDDQDSEVRFVYAIGKYRKEELLVLRNRLRDDDPIWGEERFVRARPYEITKFKAMTIEGRAKKYGYCSTNRALPKLWILAEKHLPEGISFRSIRNRGIRRGLTRGFFPTRSQAAA